MNVCEECMKHHKKMVPKWILFSLSAVLLSINTALESFWKSMEIYSPKFAAANFYACIVEKSKVNFIYVFKASALLLPNMIWWIKDIHIPVHMNVNTRPKNFLCGEN